MQVVLLIAGLILLLAGSTWFTGAATVGWICIGVCLLRAILRVGLLEAAGRSKGRS